jgi:hypothetical protein
LSTILTAAYTSRLLQAVVGIGPGAVARAAARPYLAAAGATAASFAVGRLLEPASADSLSAGAAVLVMVAVGFAAYAALLQTLDPTSAARLRVIMPRSIPHADAGRTRVGT